MPIDYQSKYPYSAEGKMAVTPETNFVDPLVALAAIAARTQARAPRHGGQHPAAGQPALPREAGREPRLRLERPLHARAGIGWLREEFDALGVSLERRGARFDDYVVAMRKVWSGDVVEHTSDFLRWSGFKSYPLPVQHAAGALPIVIGGSQGKAFERIAKYGDGWFAPRGEPGQLEPLLKELARACAKLGRDPKTIEISCMWVPAAEAPRALGAPRARRLAPDRAAAGARLTAAAGARALCERLAAEARVTAG